MTIRHGSLNNAYANIGPRSMEMDKKSVSLFEAQRHEKPSFFLAWPLFVSSSLSHQLNATVGQSHLARNFQKATQDRASIGPIHPDFQNWNCTGRPTLSRFSLRYLNGVHWLSFDSAFVKNAKMIVPLVPHLLCNSRNLVVKCPLN